MGGGEGRTELKAQKLKQTMEAKEVKKLITEDGDATDYYIEIIENLLLSSEEKSSRGNGTGLALSLSVSNRLNMIELFLFIFSAQHNGKGLVDMAHLGIDGVSFSVRANADVYFLLPQRSQDMSNVLHMLMYLPQESPLLRNLPFDLLHFRFESIASA